VPARIRSLGGLICWRLLLLLLFLWLCQKPLDSDPYHVPTPEEIEEFGELGNPAMNIARDFLKATRRRKVRCLPIITTVCTVFFTGSTCG